MSDMEGLGMEQFIQQFIRKSGKKVSSLTIATMAAARSIRLC
jgi:hypothetical protein